MQWQGHHTGRGDPSKGPCRIHGKRCWVACIRVGTVAQGAVGKPPHKPSCLPVNRCPFDHLTWQFCTGTVLGTE